MLGRSLRSHPQIYCYGEVFRSHDGTYRSFRDESLTRRIGERLAPTGFDGRFLDHLVATRPKVDAVGFKLMYDHFRRRPWLHRLLQARDARVVHLVRRNVLKGYVSHRMAEARGIWLAKAEVEQHRIRLDVTDLVGHLERRQALVDAHRRPFAGERYLEVGYEDLLTDRRPQERRILRFLGVDDEIELTTRSVKLTSERLADALENYEEVADALRGTPFEACLDEAQTS
jgi:LPS sulfotransferase NodH